MPDPRRSQTPSNTTSGPGTSGQEDLGEYETGFNPVALLAGAAFPGAGHAAAGDLRRGLHIGGGILGLYAAGMLIGGLSVVDRQENPWWFLGQAMVGPLSFGIDYVHQHHFKELNSAGHRVTPLPPAGVTPGTKVTGGPKYQRAIGKPLDVGVLFTAIAGMLNVIAVIDAGFPTRRRAGILQ